MFKLAMSFPGSPMLAAAADKTVRAALARETAALMEMVGIVHADALLASAPPDLTGVSAMIWAFDNYHCNHGRPPMAVLATAEQIGVVSAEMGGRLAEVSAPPMLDGLPDGIPGYRIAAMLHGVPLFVPVETP